MQCALSLFSFIKEDKVNKVKTYKVGLLVICIVAATRVADTLSGVHTQQNITYRPNTRQLAEICSVMIMNEQLFSQIILFLFSTSKYCCVALLTGSSSTLDTEPTGDMRAEATFSSAVALFNSFNMFLSNSLCILAR